MIRVYALLIGEKLPKNETRIKRCVIKPMTITEQRKRKFALLKFETLKDELKEYTSYVASRNNEFDQRVLKTRYVIYTDIETGHHESAINSAYRLFEDVVGALNINAVKERTLHNGDAVSYFYSYEYQIVKLYDLIDGKETELKIPPMFNGASYSKINFPREIDPDTAHFSETIENYVDLANNNQSLKQAVEYLSFAERCMSFRFPVEMSVLNLCKSIESLLYNFTFKKKKIPFKKRLEIINYIFCLAPNEISEISKLWDERNKNDVAHAAERYMHAMAYHNSLPTGKSKLLTIHQQPAIVAKMIKNYAKFLDQLIQVKVSGYERKADRQDELIYVMNRGYYTYESNQKDLKKLTPEIKKRISKDLDIPYKELKLYYHRDKKEFVFISLNKYKKGTKRQSYILFGR